MKTRFLLWMAALLLGAASAQAQPEKFDQVLYGVAYYHEYMPSDRLDEDIRLMKESGISVVRVGESTWSLFEPQEGTFEFAWMDRIIDKLHEAGIRVILGTPTYSIPAWMWHQHPDILLTYQKGGKAYYGIRQNVNYTDPRFLFYAERIIRKMMEHYAQHPGIIGYQVDNETTPRDINNDNFQAMFRNHLKEKFGTVDALNKTWGLQYWGMTINDWEELAPRDGITSTAYKLEWERFSRQAVSEFLAWQTRLVREYKRDDQFVMHCYMPSVQEVDQHESAREMDMMAMNVYHGQQDDLTGDEIAFAGDYFRSVKKGVNYLVTETNAQTIGWNSRSQQPPYPGQMRQNVYAHLGSGANMVEYWHWHSIHYGQETYWKGVLSHDLQPNRAYAEVTKTAKELEKIGKKLVNLKKENKVAILFSHDSNDGLNFMPFDQNGSPWENNPNDYYRNHLVAQFHKILYRNNIGVDFVFPEDEGYDQYDLLIIPSLYIASDLLLEKIDAYVKNGGAVIMQFKSGFCDENSMVRPVMAPGVLREACGFHYQEFSNFKTMSLKGDPFGAGPEHNKVSTWAEYLICDTAEPLAWYDHRYLGEYPAITFNKHGKGSLLYQGCLLSDTLQERIIVREMERLNLVTPDQRLQWPLITKTGTNDENHTIRYYYNYSSEPRGITYAYGNGTELVSGSPVEKNQRLTINPWDLLIIEEPDR